MRVGVVVCVLVTFAGIGAVVVASSIAGGARPVRPDVRALAELHARAAGAAFGRRVLVVRRGGTEPSSGRIFESAPAAGGFGLFDAAPPGAPEFQRACDALAARVAGEWESRGRIAPATATALAHAGVAIVCREDGTQAVAPDGNDVVAGLDPAESVPGLRVRGAEPVLRVVPGGDGAETLEPAPFLDFDDGLWGGAVTVDASAAGMYVFAWPAAGGSVTVDGADVAPRTWAGELPLLRLDLPAGRTRVVARYVEDAARGRLAIAGALAAVVGLVTLLVLVRPRLTRDADVAGQAAEPPA